MMRGRMKWFLYGMGSAGLLMLALGGTAGAVIYAAACFLFRVPELTALAGRFLRR